MTGTEPVTDGRTDVQPPPQRKSWNLCIIVCVSTIGGFLFGYDTGVVSGAMLEIKHPGSGIASNTEKLPDTAQEIIVSSTILAAAAGSMASGMLQRQPWCGRRTCAALGALLFAGGAILMAVISSLQLLILGRVIVGIAVGIASQVIPIFIAEMAPSHLRGSLTILNNCMVVMGQVTASGVCCAYAAVDQANGTLLGWRWMLGWGALPAVIMFLSLLVLPESPRWLLNVPGDSERAMKALVWLRGNEQVASQEMDIIVQAIEQDREAERRLGNQSLIKRLMRPRVKSALALGVFLMLLQQFVGINTIMYYSATILQMASRSNGDSNLASALDASLHKGLTQKDVDDVCFTVPVASCQLFGNILGMALADRLGRRTLVLISLMCCAVSLAGLGLAFFPKQDVGWLALVGMCFYLFTFGIGMAPVPWVVNAEIYPLDERSVANSIATSVNWIANFLVAMTFLNVAEGLSTNRANPSAHPDGAFWLYAAVALLGFVLLAWKMPETAGKTLEEMDDVFGRTEQRLLNAAGNGLGARADQEQTI